LAVSQNSTAPAVVYKDVPGFPDYRVGDDGSVWSRKRGDWKRLVAVSPKGRHQATLYGGGNVKTIQCHRLILEVFIGPCPAGMEGCHENGIKTDNRLENLRWDTPESNREDSAKHGTRAVGSKIFTTVLTPELATTIRERAQFGESQRRLAAEHGIHEATVSKLINRKTWAYVK